MLLLLLLTAAGNKSVGTTTTTTETRNERHEHVRCEGIDWATARPIELVLVVGGHETVEQLSCAGSVVVDVGAGDVVVVATFAGVRYRWARHQWWSFGSMSSFFVLSHCRCTTFQRG